MSNQLVSHIQDNNLSYICQSAYQQNCSIELGLLMVKTNIINALDKGKVAYLVLLDLSAVFDTINHNILLNRIDKRFGIKGMALKWFKDYLPNHTQWVPIGDKEIDGECSDKINMHYVVPQGSIVGPILSHYTLLH